ncbi:hypothetical protein G4B88_019449 [Cannabis sativa]|uniref:Uncharacterized protein n=1 Tax=Cannabis sativa TaxID=3483 RepID=A0A7J6I0S9_CANSA|nr:hypothetical protein G4B88_019449 [Cannabis sativa]
MGCSCFYSFFVSMKNSIQDVCYREKKANYCSNGNIDEKKLTMEKRTKNMSWGLTMPLAKSRRTTARAIRCWKERNMSFLGV